MAELKACFSMAGTKTPQHSDSGADGLIIHCLRQIAFLFDPGSNEHLAVLQLNLPHILKKLFCCVF